MAEKNLDPAQQKKGLLTIQDKIHQYKPKGVQTFLKANETRKLFHRRFSVLPGNINKFQINQTAELKSFKRRFTPLQGLYKPIESPKNPIKNDVSKFQRGKQIDMFLESPPPPGLKPAQLPTNAASLSKMPFPGLNEARLQKRRIENAGQEGSNAKKIQTESIYGGSMNYGIVFNVAFAIVRKESERKILYKCNIPGCVFEVFNDKEIKKHFEIFHNGKTWNGFCGKCAKINFYPGPKVVTIIDELKHIEEHINITSVNEKQTVASRGKVLDNDFMLNSGTSRHIAIDSLNVTAIKTARLNNPQFNHSVENFCNAIESLNLQPWLNNAISDRKSKAAAISMLHEIPLTALFKCMQTDCIYFTSDSVLFQRHLNYHAGKEVSHACSYCHFKGSTSDKIIGHIQENHYTDAFQCAFCFYRALTKNNLITHAKQYHADKQNVVMIECFRRENKETREKLQSEAQSFPNIQKFVHPLKCFCEKEFYMFDLFEKHVQRGHGGSFSKKYCSKCNKDVCFKDIIAHMETCLKMSRYQCLFCVFGVQDVKLIFEHLANCHPSKYPLYCDRLHADANRDPSSYKSLNFKLIDHKPLGMIVIKSADDNTVALRNAHCVENLNSNQKITPSENASSAQNMVDNDSDSNSDFTIPMSIFSEPSDLSSTMASLDQFNTDEIEYMFDDLDISTSTSFFAH